MLIISRETLKLNRRAVTFLEVLIAIGIIALAIMPSINLFTSIKKYTIHTDDVQIALRLAQEKVEEYKSVSFLELKTLLKNGLNKPEPEIQVTSQTNTAGTAYSSDIYKKFKRQTTIAYMNNDPDMVMVTVFVWWYDGTFSGGDQRYVTLKALVTRDYVL